MPMLQSAGRGMPLMLLLISLWCIAGTPSAARAQGKASSPLAPLPPLAPAGQSPTPVSDPAAESPAGGLVSTVLYGGQTADQAGLTATAWGGGSASIVSDRAFSPGKNSIKIQTRGLYQGGRLTLATPAQLGDLTADKSRYIQLALGFVTAAPDGDNPDGNPPSLGGSQDQQEGLLNTPARVFTAEGHGSVIRLAQGRGYGPPPGYNGPPPGFRPPGFPPGFPGVPGAPRQRSDAETLDIVQPPIKSLHLIFTFADGSQTDVVRPVPALESGEHWLLLGIPLSQVPVPASQAHNAQLQSLMIAGDAPTTLYVGQVRLVSDSLPITCSTGGEQDVARGDTVILKGKAQGGAANLRYEWDFDTKGDFIPQAEGREVTHVYTQSGSYKVTLRVSDVDGIKAPAISTSDIHIED